MTGYNHYHNCSCGWCVGKGRQRAKENLRRERAIRTAGDFLRRHDASGLGSTCFVSPNSKCPICKAGVYFYSNSNGSKVFFDQLGPPWPKHPCTDRPNVAARATQTASRPLRRSIGLIKEIIGNGSIIDMSKVPDIGRSDRPNLSSWRLLVITSMRERGGIVVMEADFVETIYHQHITLTAPASRALYIGQFVSVKDDVLSFFDERAGRRRDVVVRYKGVVKQATPSVPGQTLDSHGLPASLKTEGIPGVQERLHYISSDPASGYYCRVKELIQRAAKAGATYLADFQIAMNDSRIHTLRGSRWTREIVSGLIYDMRHEDLIPSASGLANTPGHTGQIQNSGGQKSPFVQRERPNPLQIDKIMGDLRGVEERLRELETAWDAALTPAHRQKIRDQIDSQRRKRAEMLKRL